MSNIAKGSVAYNARTYLMDDKGINVRLLPAVPEAKHVWGSWSHEGQQIAFAPTWGPSGVLPLRHGPC